MDTVTKQKKDVPRLRFANFNDEWRKFNYGDFLSMKLREVDKPSINFLALGVRSHFKGLFHKRDFDPNKIGMDKMYIVKKNDLVVNITFAWEGAMAIASSSDDGGLVSHRFPTYEFDQNLVKSVFFKYVFPRDKTKYLLTNISPGGAGRNRVLKKSDFLKLKTFAPLIQEQQKIADFLDSVDTWLDNLRQQKTALETYKRGMMQKLFTQQVRFKDENGKDFPKWKTVQMSNIGESYGGLSGKSAEDFGRGQPYITYKQIFDNSVIDEDGFGLVSVAPRERQNQAQRGDILFTTSSETPEEVGYASVLLADETPYLNSFSFGFRPRSLNELLPEYARYHFRSAPFRREVVKLAQGSTRYNISKVQFMKLTTALPSANEQQKVADFLTAIDQTITAKADEINKVEQWKKGLIQKMFV